MTLKEELIDYDDDGTTLQGLFVHDEALACGGARLALVLVGHAWAGRDEFANGRARALAQLGYAAFAIDVYGKGVLGSGPEENMKLRQPLIENRKSLLLRRSALGLGTALKQPVVDAARVGAVGYCFGGRTVLDMARANLCLKAVVSLHGNLTPSEVRAAMPIFVKNTYYFPVPLGEGPIKAAILVCHGHEDPMIPPQQVLAFEQEMATRKADWQVHVYGNAVHAFTLPSANDRHRGACYDRLADQRSWAALKFHLQEHL